jgi:hypothetical protein
MSDSPLKDFFPWFDRVAEECKKPANRAKMEPVLQAVSKAATKENLLALLAIPGILPFSKNADDILNGARYIKTMYRYRYSQNKNMVSATSELFSLIKQAIVYHDKD